MRDTYMLRYNLIFLILRRWCFCGAGEQSETVRAHRGAVGSRISQRELTSLNFRPYVDLPFSRDQHDNACSPTQSFFFIGHGFHPSNICSPLVTAYTHVFFMSQVLRLRIACFPIVTMLILSLVGCISQLHLLGSPPDKAIYCRNIK